MKPSKMEYNELRTIAVLSESDGMTLEAKLISWDGAKPVLDIRHWSKDHETMSHGIKLNEYELNNLIEGLREYRDEVKKAKEAQGK